MNDILFNQFENSDILVLVLEKISILDTQNAYVFFFVCLFYAGHGQQTMIHEPNLLHNLYKYLIHNIVLEHSYLILCFPQLLLS